MYENQKEETEFFLTKIYSEVPAATETAQSNRGKAAGGGALRQRFN